MGDSLVAQTVKSLPAMWETWVQSLCQEGPLEKEITTHSSILAWRIPWMDESDRLQSVGWQSQTQLSDFSSTTKKHAWLCLCVGLSVWCSHSQ